MAARRLLATTASTTIRRLTTTTATTTPRLSLLRTLSALSHLTLPTLPPSSQRLFSTEQAPIDSNPPNNRDSKEKVLLDGCDFEHWLVVMDPPPKEWTREQIIDDYIKTLATAVGSEEEARMKLYSVSTRHYFAFGALVPEEVSSKLKDLEKVRWVLPDSYLDVKNKDYGGEPVINGQAVPYDPKYHEEWVRNNLKALDRNSRSERPRQDRSRNFDNRQQRPQGFQNTPGGNMGGAPDQRGPPNNAGRGPNMPPPNNAGYQQNMPPPNNAGYQQNMPPRNNGYQQLPPNNAGYQQNMPPNNAGNRPNMPPNNAGYQQNMPPTNAGHQPNMAPNHAGYQPNMPQSNAGYQPNMPPNPAAGYQNAPNGNYQAQNVPGRDGPQ